MKIANLKGLSKKQREIIHWFLLGEERVIKMMQDYTDMQQDFTMDNEEGEFDTITLDQFSRLLKRNIIYHVSTREAALNIFVSKYKLNPFIKLDI
jgi:hypothetical protein